MLRPRKCDSDDPTSSRIPHAPNVGLGFNSGGVINFFLAERLWIVLYGHTGVSPRSTVSTVQAHCHTEVGRAHV